MLKSTTFLSGAIAEKATQQRAYYRLQYPSCARPSLLISGTRYLVSELSEQGLRLLKAHHSLDAVGVKVRGELSLHDNTELSLAGHVIRMEEKEVIVKLDAGPSFKNMLDEQRFMRSNYPEIT
ncbi:MULTISPECIES: PilZ domain-containing protein [Vibrio]|uniref:PilZ domain-containing protein n=1 Tax=Vibrio rotiferianus TaxID=190895 RepID=A0A510IAK3_9VIBR|nr:MULTISPECIES: PilZ domain-containing protein [Vibrio]MDK9775977.1 PilZ domain-containing protein [Vibrio sp. D401a]MDK9805999.1 PilZ domain-containing protein [Vibrio sp. D406a]TMX62229.1 PilZ domain-containing protein [Vibrio rotiferianus]USD52239.1 PilZ domain-containing protein [Vibrio sp. SCSIO 43153]BBL90805.1 hypothetical protein VroAM7_34580 [Vibrio rotiferianus]